MAEVQYLNDRSDARVCRSMIALVEDQLEAIDKRLTQSVLEREDYLQAVGARRAVSMARGELQKMYDREFNV